MLQDGWGLLQLRLSVPRISYLGLTRAVEYPTLMATIAPKMVPVKIPLAIVTISLTTPVPL